jgi:hypothetical protein
MEWQHDGSSGCGAANSELHPCQVLRSSRTSNRCWLVHSRACLQRPHNAFGAQSSSTPLHYHALAAVPT